MNGMTPTSKGAVNSEAFVKSEGNLLKDTLENNQGRLPQSLNAFEDATNQLVEHFSDEPSSPIPDKHADTDRKKPHHGSLLGAKVSKTLQNNIELYFKRDYAKCKPSTDKIVNKHQPAHAGPSTFSKFQEHRGPSRDVHDNKLNRNQSLSKLAEPKKASPKVRAMFGDNPKDQYVVR